MNLERIGESFAARVTGIDLASGVTAEQHAETQRALAQYPVLSFPRQRVTDDEQSRFIHAMGPAFEVSLPEVARAEKNNPLLSDVTNVEPDGTPVSAKKARFYDSNLNWHSDGSFSAIPTWISTLSARVLPKVPPPTEYADMRAAWDALPAALKAKCEKLTVRHSLYFSRARVGLLESELSEGFKQQSPVPALQPLVRTHPVSGRKSLYLSAHAGGIVGWPDDEGSGFLDELTTFATQPQFVFSYAWQPDDLVMWDNRCTMHRSTPYANQEARVMRWAAVTETEPLVSQTEEAISA
jgi:alpha-ketoglutarate-dependent 2,4-dichlorophenoxyacetate dioxygenase